MATKLYVGNLAWATTADTLKDAFSQVGNVLSSVVMTDKMTGRSRGFGFVEVEDANAEKTIEMFNGNEVDGRKITVNVARPPSERPPRRF